MKYTEKVKWNQQFWPFTGGNELISKILWKKTGHRKTRTNAFFTVSQNTSLPLMEERFWVVSSCSTFIYLCCWCVFYAFLRSSSVTHALVVGRTILFSFWPSSRRNTLSNWPTDFDQRWRWFVWSEVLEFCESYADGQFTFLAIFFSGNLSLFI